MSNPLVSVWQYDQGDPGIVLFTSALKAWEFDIPDGARVLELGCCETDWAHRLKAVRPNAQVTGIDVRPCPTFPGEFIQADAAWHRWHANSFDWIVALSSVEHFGLGWQEYGDPVYASADISAIEIASEALVDGGHIYYDVPYTPERMFQTAHWRCYDDEALDYRLMPEGCILRARGFVRNEGERDLSPVRPLEPMSPFYMTARWMTKVTK